MSEPVKLTRAMLAARHAISRDDTRTHLQTLQLERAHESGGTVAVCTDGHMLIAVTDPGAQCPEPQRIRADAAEAIAKAAGAPNKRVDASLSAFQGQDRPAILSTGIQVPTPAPDTSEGPAWRACVAQSAPAARVVLSVDLLARVVKAAAEFHKAALTSAYAQTVTLEIHLGDEGKRTSQDPVEIRAEGSDGQRFMALAMPYRDEATEWQPSFERHAPEPLSEVA